MSHPSIENRTPCAYDSVFLADEEGYPVLVTLVRATYVFAGHGLTLAEVQPPVPTAGELYGDSPATSSWRYEPETAFIKPATDVILIGHAVPPFRGAVESDVHFQVGPVSKAAHIFGDRQWVRSAGAVTMTKPQPFDRIPLVYERAFGGRDGTVGTPERPAFETRNPIGRGYRAPGGSFEEGIYLPNIEDPADPIQRYGQVTSVVGFGFTAANWQPRAALAGTYDATWIRDRMPGLPQDFDRRFFNAAAVGLVAPGYLRGDEPVAVSGVSTAGPVAFRLPGPTRPTCTVTLLNRGDVRIESQLDTVVVDTTAQRVHLSWRGQVRLRDGAHDVQSIVVDGIHA